MIINIKIMLKHALQIRTHLYSYSIPDLLKVFALLAGKTSLCLSPLTQRALFSDAGLCSPGPKAALHWFARVGQVPM